MNAYQEKIPVNIKCVDLKKSKHLITQRKETENKIKMHDTYIITESI